MASMQEIDDLYQRVADHDVNGTRFNDTVVSTTRWFTRWKDEPTELVWAVVHMVAHGARIEDIMERICKGEAPDGMVPADAAAEQALEEIRRMQ